MSPISYHQSIIINPLSQIPYHQFITTNLLTLIPYHQPLSPIHYHQSQGLIIPCLVDSVHQTANIKLGSYCDIGQ